MPGQLMGIDCKNFKTASVRRVEAPTAMICSVAFNILDISSAFCLACSGRCDNGILTTHARGAPITRWIILCASYRKLGRSVAVFLISWLAPGADASISVAVRFPLRLELVTMEIGG